MSFASLRLVRRLALPCLGLGLLGACQTINGPTPAAGTDLSSEPTSALSLPADVAMLGASVIVVVDQLAPTWHVEQHDLGNGRYAIAMRKRRLTIGGDGESQQIFRRRIDQIARERGFAAYEVLELSEGIDSSVPMAQRVSRGVVQFHR